MKTFCLWIWKSVYQVSIACWIASGVCCAQGSVIILFAILFFNDSYVNIVTITFTALILIELLNVYTQINNMNMQMVFIMLATAVTYFMSIILLKSYFETSYMDQVFFTKVGILAFITWFPIQLIYLIVECMDPSENQKLKQNVEE